MSRDRDEAGRARNARPRDELGRPLPRGTTGVPPVPDDLDLGPSETLAEAQRLLDAGRPFQAHEVLEAMWKHAEPDERELWQGMAQLAVGLTHLGRGNIEGGRRLLRRGSHRLRAYAGNPPHGVDVPGLLSFAELAQQGEPGPLVLRASR